MSAGLTLAAAGLVSWSLRVLFITVVPARKLPDRIRRALDHTGPAALAALVATGLARPAPGSGFPVPTVLALLVGALVAWRTRSLLISIAAAVGAFALLTP